MLSLPKIIAPVGFSERSPGAARYDGRLACHFHSELTLLHVMDTSAYEFSAYEFTGPVITTSAEERKCEAEALLANFLPGEFRNMNVRRLVLTGDPAGEIVAFAHAERASLIVIPTHGYGPFRRFIMGSVTAKVLHDAQCPVLTGVHVEGAPSEQDLGISQIVCAVDLGPDSERVLRWADRFARTFGSKLMAVHITRDGKEEVAPGETSRVRLRSPCLR